jgi:hypothetical protein
VSEYFQIDSKDLILKTFEVDKTAYENELTEQQLLGVLSEKIAYMIEYQLDLLLSLMYRMDIDEDKINSKLMPGTDEPANEGLARLVLERQKQKIETQKTYNINTESTDSWSFDI